MDNNYLQLTGGNPFGSQAKMLLHWDRLNEYMQTGDTSCPIFMEVGLTNRCNESCVWCITENGRDNKHGESLELDISYVQRNHNVNITTSNIEYANRILDETYTHTTSLFACNVGFKDTNYDLKTVKKTKLVNIGNNLDHLPAEMKKIENPYFLKI